jgi:dTDP-4-dehydrorhamnose 3,5-epimerase
MAFTFTPLSIKEVVLIKPDIYRDDRGYFAEIFKKPMFEQNGVSIEVVQVNHSRSSKDVIRGLHYQLNPKAQGKLLTVVSGAIFDVAVDIRKGSATYGKWVSQKLTAENKEMLFIPTGFAHGLCTLEDNTEVIYYCTEEYSPEHERGIIWNDPSIAIIWPVSNPTISPRDAVFPVLAEAENNFSV